MLYKCECGKVFEWFSDEDLSLSEGSSDEERTSDEELLPVDLNGLFEDEACEQSQ